MTAPESSPAKKVPATERKASRRGLVRWRRVIPILILFLCIVVWLTPAILIRTSLRHRIVGSLFPAYTGQASIGSAYLSWTAPVVLRKVELSDAEGHVWMTIPELTTSRTLFSLLFEDTSDLGTFTMVRPRLSVEIRDDGSNFEDRLWEFLADTDEGDQATAVTIVIEEGTAVWSDPTGDQEPAGLFDINATIHQSATAPFPGPVKFSARVKKGERSGPITLTIDEPPTKKLVAKVATDKIPLATLVPWLNRFGVAVSGTGRLTGDLKITCDPQVGVPLAVSGRLAGHQLRAGYPPILEEQYLDLEQITLSGQVSYDGRQIGFEQAVLESPIARVDLTGSIDPAALTSAAGWRRRIGAILEDDVNLNGRINLARLPGVLTSQLPEDKRIETGRIQFSLRTDGEQGNRRGVARVTTTDLVVSLPGEDVTWESPLAMTVTLRQDNNGLSAERIHIESDFIKLNGSIAGDGGEISFEANLNQLRKRLTRFLPIDEETLAGQASGTFRLTARDEPGLFDLSAKLRLRDFQVAWNGRRWSEKDLQATGQAVVRLADRGIRDIKPREVTIEGAAGDELTLSVIEETKQEPTESWPVAVSIQGDVARWITRLKSVGIVPDELAWTLQGQIDASARVVVGATETGVEDLQCAITSFEARHGTFVIAEPKLSVQGDVLHQSDRGTISSQNLRAECESFGLQTKTLSISLSEPGTLQFQGTIRGSLSRLARWGLPPGSDFWPTGVVSGDLAISHSAAASEIVAELVIEQWELNRRVAGASGQAAWRPVWTDPSVSLQLNARYDSTAPVMTIKNTRWRSAGAAVQLAGRIQQPLGRADMSIDGKFTYDLAKLQSHIRPLRKGGIQLAGAQTREFSIRGPLFAAKGGLDPTLAAHLRLGWQQVKLRSLSLGPGELDARLQGGQLALATSEIPVADGSAQLDGVIAMNIPLVGRLGSGRIINEVTLTPEMCGTWMSYAAPLLADVAEVEGTFSLDLGGAAIPLFHPAGVRAEATLAIDGVSAEPGPMARAVLNTVGQIQRIAGKEATQGSDLQMTAPEQNVQLTIAQGRVHHDRFVVRLGDKDGPLVTTSGSVGFNDTLKLTVAVPLKKEWFKNKRVAAVLGGQILRIPVSGTLSQPVIDPRALQNLARRAATGAAKNWLQQELQEQLGNESGSPLRGLFE